MASDILTEQKGDIRMVKQFTIEAKNADGSWSLVFVAHTLAEAREHGQELRKFSARPISVFKNGAFVEEI